MTTRCLACGNTRPCLACGSRAHMRTATDLATKWEAVTGVRWSPPQPDTRSSEQWEADERRIERVEVDRMFDALDDSPSRSAR